MTLRTRAAVVRQHGSAFTFEDVEIDEPRPDEVLVRIVACGVCHTDMAARDGLLGVRFPAVLGHEGAGIVEKVGTDVARIRPGDKVVLSFNSCGECSDCREGRPARCSSFMELNFGAARVDGSPTIWDANGAPVGGSFFGQSSFAFHALTRERNAILVDAPNEDELAALAPLGCGVQAGAGTVLNELKPRPGESIVVFGAGTVGLSAVMAARLAGADPIIAVDIVSTRLELAMEIGANFAINAREEDVGERLGQIVPGVDHAVETTGDSWVIARATRSLGPRGNLSLLGVSAEVEDEDQDQDKGEDKDDQDKDKSRSISPKSPGPHQKVFYSIAGDSNPQTFIPLLIRLHREGKFPFDKLIREYAASRINEAVRDSLDGVTIKPLLRF